MEEFTHGWRKEEERQHVIIYLINKGFLSLNLGLWDMYNSIIIIAQHADDLKTIFLGFSFEHFFNDAHDYAQVRIVEYFKSNDGMEMPHVKRTLQ